MNAADVDDLPPIRRGRPYRLTIPRILIAAALARSEWMRRGSKGSSGFAGPNGRAWASAMYDYAIAMEDFRLLPDEVWPAWWRRDPLPDLVPGPSATDECAGRQMASREWRTPSGDGTRRTARAALHDHSGDEHKPYVALCRRIREESP